MTLPQQSEPLGPPFDDFRPCPDCGTLHDEDYCPVCEEFA